MKIYTRTGDSGKTGLWGGGRISKDAVRIHAYGTVDECNALLGVVRTGPIDGELNGILETIQNHLFVVGSDLATPGDMPPAIPRISPDEVVFLEQAIDRLEQTLPQLKQFIVPGGVPAAAYLHLARTICRRAERWTVTLTIAEPIHQQVVIYLNRLSDFLFVAARAANHRAGTGDHPWINPRRPGQT